MTRGRAGAKATGTTPAPVSRWTEAFLEMLAAERGAADNTIESYLFVLNNF